MSWRKSPPALVDLFDRVLPQDHRIERRKMFGYPAAFVNGQLFAGLHQESFILRLPGPDRERLQGEHGASMFEPMPGRAMREYLVLPDAVLSNDAVLTDCLARSLAYAAALPPKPARARRGTAVRRRGAGAKGKSSRLPRASE